MKEIVAKTKTDSDSFTNTIYQRIKRFFDTANAEHIFVQGSTLVLLLGAVYMVYILQEDFDQYHVDRNSSVLGQLFLAVSIAIFAFKAFYFVFMAIRYFKYRAIASVSDDDLPTCTIIVPAYNEGKQVWSTLHSLSKSDFPEQKLQIISIDDGSQDDTWQWMLRAKEELGDRIEIYQQAKNKGKRHALYRGFNLGKGEVFVTVDKTHLL